jgi:hypothetical protein
LRLSRLSFQSRRYRSAPPKLCYLRRSQLAKSIPVFPFTEKGM